MRWRKIGVLIGAAVLLGGSAEALTISGDIELIAEADVPVASSGTGAGNRRLFQGDVESSTKIRLLPEVQDFALSVDQTVSFTPDQASSPVSPPGPTGVIEAGTEVNSHLLHFDPIGNSFVSQISLTGSVTFDTDILGLIVGVSLLDGTDSAGYGSLGHPATPNPLGVPTIFYGWGGVRGLESNDTIQVSPDHRTLTVWLNVGPSPHDYGIDQVRVLTAIPEPSAFALLACGLAGLALRRRIRA